MDGSNGVSPFRFLSHFRRAACLALNLCSVSSVMVRLQFLFVFAASFPDYFVSAGSLCWVVVKSGTDCSIQEEFIGAVPVAG